MYMIHPNDNERYHGELKLLRRELRSPSGTVTNVVAGDPFVLDGIVLYPMEVFFKDTPCHPYMLLLETGTIESADSTPYFFKNRISRDKAVASINRVKGRLNAMSPSTVKAESDSEEKATENARGSPVRPANAAEATSTPPASFHGETIPLISDLGAAVACVGITEATGRGPLHDHGRL
jgi:hypothetical protein